MRHVLVLASVLFMPVPAAAECPDPVGTVHTAASLSATEVQDCIDESASGDTVLVPAGGPTAWSTQVTIAGKALNLFGTTLCTGAGPTLACTDSTTITCAIRCLKVTTSATNFVRVSGFTFTTTTGDVNNGHLTFDGTGQEVGFRMDNVRLSITSACNCVGSIVVYSTYGLFDHLLVTVTDAHVWGMFGDFGDAGFRTWKLPMDWGTQNMIVIEDSKITSTDIVDGIMDGYAGGRWAFRYNAVIVTGNSNGKDILGVHGTDSGGKLSWMLQEVYGNTFTNNAAGTNTFNRIRGGTGVFYDNTFNGTQSWTGVILQIYRIAACGSWTFDDCDGTQLRATPTDGPPSSEWAASTGGTYKFCAANPGTYCTADATCIALSGGDTCTRWFDGAGTNGYPCRGQPGRGTNETLEPLYAWNNTGGVALDADGSCGGGDQVQENRDFYNDTEMPGYTPLAYPHPLQGADEEVAGGRARTRLRIRG